MSAADVTPAVTDDFASSTATTGSVSVGGSTSGNIETGGDTDWFRITLTAGHRYQFDLQGSPTGQGTLADPFLRLRDSAGNSLASNDGNGTNLNSRITYDATSSSTYYLSTGSSNVASGTGTYRVSAADVTPAVTDDFASSTATTGSVSVGGSTSGNIETAGDTDWFKITLTAGQTYQFDLKGGPSGNGNLPDPFLRLRDSSGNTIANAFADDGGTGLDSRFTYTPSSGGTYILSAGSATPSGTGTYKVFAANVTPAAAAHDPIASGGTYTKTAGQSTPLTSLFSFSDLDNDIVAFAVKDRELAGGYLTKNGVQQTENFTFDNQPIGQISQWAFVAGPAGSTSTIGFNAIDSRGVSNPSATSTVNVATVSGTIDTVPHTTSTSFTLAVNGFANGAIDARDLDGTTPDKDWYKVSLIANHRYDFTPQHTSGMVDAVAMRVYIGNSTSVSSLADNNTPLEFTPSSSGNYYLAISASGANFLTKTGNYQITLSDNGVVTPQETAQTRSLATAIRRRTVQPPMKSFKSRSYTKQQIMTMELYGAQRTAQAFCGPYHIKPGYHFSITGRGLRRTGNTYRTLQRMATLSQI